MNTENPDSKENISQVWFPYVKYRHQKEIASGGFGKMYTACTTGDDGKVETVCIKKIYFSRPPGRRMSTLFRFLYKNREEGIVSREREDVQNEIIVLCHLQDHKFIIELKKVFEHRNSFWIVTEYAKYRDLRELAQVSNILDYNNYDNESHLSEPRQKSLPTHIILHLISPIFEAVKYMHSKGIIHGDIKEDNILLTANGVPKIADFGGARRFDSLPVSYDSNYSGTEFYFPPEIVKEEEYDTTVDTWALGVTMLSMHYCGWPFERDWVDMSTYLMTGYPRLVEGRIRGIKTNAQEKLYSLARLVWNEKDYAGNLYDMEWRSFSSLVRKTLIYEREKRPTVHKLCEDSYMKPSLEAWKQFGNMEKCTVNDDHNEPKNAMLESFCDKRRFVLDFANDAYSILTQGDGNP